MPPRNPATTQVDFPQLVADMIGQLNIRGTVGLLDFVPAIQPVYIAAQREGALTLETAPVVFGTAEIFSDETVAPTVAEVLADTGPLPAGKYDCIVDSRLISGASGVIQSNCQFQHRNAGNTANLWSMDLAFYSHGAVGQTNGRQTTFAIEISDDERLRFQNLIGIAAGVIYDTVIFARRRVVP